MNRLPILVAAASLCSLSVNVSAADPLSRKDFASDAGYVLGTYAPPHKVWSCENAVAAVNRLTDSLDEQLQQELFLSLNSATRRQWSNRPTRGGHHGVALSRLTPDQLKMFCDLLAALVSEHGYRKVTTIMLGDDLRSQVSGRRNRGVGIGQFYLSVFGTPGTDSPWAVQLDGHHLALNIAIHGPELSMSPAFFGTRPAVFQASGEEVEPFAKEVELAFDLVNSLDSDQKRAGVVGRQRGQIRTGPGTDNDRPEFSGIEASRLSEAQQEQLMGLMAEWINILPPAHAERRLAELRAGISMTKFAWFGPTRPGSDVSWSVSGPEVIIEFACQDLGGAPTDHLHTMYRDPTNDYGLQLSEAR